MSRLRNCRINSTGFSEDVSIGRTSTVRLRSHGYLCSYSKMSSSKSDQVIAAKSPSAIEIDLNQLSKRSLHRVENSRTLRIHRYFNFSLQQAILTALRLP